MVICGYNCGMENENTNIEDLSVQLRELENNIFNLISDFNKKTGCLVNDINVSNNMITNKCDSGENYSLIGVNVSSIYINK